MGLKYPDEQEDKMAKAIRDITALADRMPPIVWAVPGDIQMGEIVDGGIVMSAFEPVFLEIEFSKTREKKGEDFIILTDFSGSRNFEDE